MPNKTALEVTVDKHERDINIIADGMKDILNSITGLREDVSARAERVIVALNLQNASLLKAQNDLNISVTKNMTDHEALDVSRFSEIKSKVAFYSGAAAVVSPMILIGLDYYLRTR